MAADRIEKCEILIRQPEAALTFDPAMRTVQDVKTILWYNLQLSEVMACEGQYALSLLLSDLCSVSPWRGRRDLQVLLCVLTTLISGSETELLPDHLSERRDGACCPGETTSPRHLHYTHLSAVKRTRGHISHFGQKKRQLPIILSGLDSPHLFGWCRRLVATDRRVVWPCCVLWTRSWNTAVWAPQLVFIACFSIPPQHRLSGYEHWKVPHPDREARDREVSQEKTRHCV